jgi:hypothetical protein
VAERSGCERDSFRGGSKAQEARCRVWSR